MITTGFDARVKIQQIIENQLPEFLLSESPKSVDFLRQYYASQEYQGGPVDIAENLDQYLNLNNLSPEVITGITSLTSSVNNSDSTIYVESTKGFPKQYGLFKIDDEIITYTGITTNSFTGCVRGFSGITSYRNETDPEELVFSTSSSASHLDNTRVHNLSSLFLKEFYKKLKYLLAPGFEDVDFVSELDINNFIKSARSFYLSKGTDESFRILFNVLYGTTPKIINLENFLLKSSGAEFIRREVLVTERISGDPLKLVGQMVRNIDDSATGPVSEVEIITRNNKTFYKIQLFSGYDEKSLIEGTFVITPKSIVSDNVSIGSSVITVDSTIGFPESGTLVSGSNTITYTNKSINQFFGCDGVTSAITSASDIRSNHIIYGYEDGDTSKKVQLRVTGVLSKIENPDDFTLLLDGDNITVKNLGDKVSNNNKNNKEFAFNTWIYNVRSRYEIRSFNNNQLTLFEIPDKSSLKVNDIVDVLDRNSENIIVSNANVTAINGSLIEIDKNVTGVASNRRLSIRRRYRYASSLNTPISASNILSNIQNTYSENEDYIYVASNSLPSYQISKKLSTANITLSPSSNLNDIFQNYNPLTDLYSVLSFNNDVPFVTGDAIVYHGDTEEIPGLVFGRTYYVEVIEESGRKNKIRLFNARSFVATQSFVEFGRYGENSNHNFTILQHYNKSIVPKKTLLKFPLKSNIEGGSALTEVGTIGKLVNGVDIINYKTNDRIYYGPIDSLRIYNSGDNYDVINPPSIVISGPVGVGTTALAQAVVRGSVKSVLVDPQNFSLNRVLSVTIKGGNGQGAKLQPVLGKQYREIEFNGTQVGLAATGGVDINNESITFNDRHNLESGEKIVYNSAGNQPLGIGSFKFSNTDQGRYLVNGSTYYPQVINTRAIYLYETEEDYLSGINTVGFTTINTGGTHKFRLFDAKDVISEIRVINPGSGYENRSLKVKATGISTEFNKITFANHGFKDGDLVNYSYEISGISGLSTSNQYRVIKLNDSDFQLADAGAVGAASTDYNRKKYVKFESTGSGYQTFSYPQIQIEINAEFSGSSIGTITATPQVRGEIVDVYLYENGTNYGSEILNFHKNPSVNIRNGVGAELKPILKSGRIVAVEVQNGGKYYNAAPDLVVNGTGSGAKLRASVVNGIIKDVIIINQGTNYQDSNTSISVIPPGKNAVIESNVRYLSINNKERFSDEILTDYENNLSYGIVGYSTDRDGGEFSDPNQSTGHSRVIGWAIDGNPIYGPYGYSDPKDNNSRIVILKTGYESSPQNIYNRPPISSFPLGFFVEDFKYTNSGNLDEHNGRFAKTPEYPNGVYAYYVGVATASPSGKLTPRFPYFIGNSFRSHPVVNNLDQSFDFNNSSLVRNTFPYRVNQDNSGNDFIVESNEFFNQVTTVESVSEGDISSITVINPGQDYRVGNLLVFENDGTGGGGLSAEVSRLKGFDINNIQTTYNNFENSIVTWQDKETLRVHTSGYHSLNSGDFITISGISTFVDGLLGSHIIGVSSIRTSLSEDVSANVGLVTDIYVSFIDANVGSGTTIGIGTEILSVLNRFDSDNILRVKRGSTGTAHTSGDIVHYFADSFTIPLESEYFDSTKNIKIYFNPTESVGVGIDTGSETSINYYVGNTPKVISVPTQNIYIPNHPFKNNQRLTLTIPPSSSALSVSDTSGGSTFDLPSSGSSQDVYVINKSKDFVGLTTLVGLTSTSGGLFFTNNGSDNYEYSLETNYTELTATAQRIKATVSISTVHGLIDNDEISILVKPKLSVGVGASNSIRMKYNEENKKLLVNTVGFTSDRINTSTDQIYIKNHGFASGEKVFYNSSDLVASGLSTGSYYVYKVDSDNIKLSETFNDVNANPPLTVSIASTGGSGQELSLINPQLKITKNNKIFIDVSHPSLSNYEFKLFYDQGYESEFVSTGSTNTFNIQKTIVGGSTTSITINYDNSLPTKLYYSFEKEGVLIEPDIDVKKYSELLYVNSLYNGSYKVFGIGSTSFNISLNEVPEKLSYSSEECDAIEYDTSSTEAYGPIKDINIISGGFNYKILPRIVGVTTGSSTSVGSNSVLRANTNTIGKINQYRIINEGFEYSSDKTLRPKAEVPTTISLKGSQKIENVSVLDGGKNYISAPSLVIVNLYDRSVVNSGLLVANFKGNTIVSVDVVEEPKGLDDVDHRIFTTNNSNGVQVERVLSYSGGIVECELSTPPIDGFITPPFNVGDRIFVEGIQKQSFTDALGNVTSPGTGFNSSENGYNFFEVVEYTNSNPAILKYNIGEYTENAGTPVTIQTTFNSIVKNQNYPVFKITRTPGTFFDGEPLSINNVSTDLIVKVVRKNFIKVTGDYEIKNGDRIKGINSGNFATIDNIYKTSSRFNINYSNKKELDWKNDVGKLNYDLQVLPNNDYYQNLSYTIKSKIEYEKMRDKVNQLVHPTGLKNFADTEITSKANVSIASSISLLPVLDFISERRVDTINNFDLALDYDPTNTSSRFITFKNKKLSDYVECRSNRVLQIDDISGRFSSSEFNKETFTDTIEYPITDFYSKFLVQVMDEDKQSTQVSEIVVLNDYNNTYTLNKIDLYTDKKLGDFSGAFGDVGDPILRFNPTNPNEFNYNLKIYRESFTSDPFSIGIGFTQIGFTRLSAITENVGPSGGGLLGVSTTVFQAQAAQYDTVYAFAQVTDTVTNQSNYFEVAGHYDGTNTYVSEFYFDTQNSSVSAGFIGTFGLNVDSGVLSLSFKNENSNNNVRVKTKVVGIGSTSIGVGTYRYTVDGQIDGTERTARLDSQYEITSGISTIISFNSVLDSTLKSIVKVSVGSTVALHNLLVIADQIRTNIQHSQFMSVGSGTGIGTFGSEMNGTNVIVKFYPDSEYSSDNVVVQTFNQFIYSDIDEFNIPGNLTYGNGIEGITNAFYGSINEFGKDKLDFDLNYNRIPIFEKTFNPNDSSALNRSTGVFSIDNHFFETGEELIYTPNSTLIGINPAPMGIGETIVSGRSFTADFIVGFSTVTGIAVTTGITTDSFIFGDSIPSSTTKITGITTNYTFFVGQSVGGGSSVITGVGNTSIITVGAGIFSGDNTGLGTVTSIGINSITSTESIPAGTNRIYYTTDEAFALELDGVSVGSTFRKTYSTGITTDICPTTVYAIRISKDQFKLTGTAGGSGIGFTFTSIGGGNRHELEMKKKLEKTLITIDGVTQYPLMYTPLTYTLENNNATIGAGITFLSLSGISSIKPKDILKIDDEFLNIKNVGFGTTTAGPIDGTGNIPIIEVSRGFVGSSATTHSNGSEVRIYKGAYNIVGNKIHFTEAPDGKGNNNRLNSSNLSLPKSSFNGRVYLRKDYTDNKIYDDISLEFNGIGRTFTVYKEGQNTTGLEAGSNLVFINDIFQTPDTSNNSGNNYSFEETLATGISSITFTGIKRPNTDDVIIVESDVNQNQIPRGGVVIALAQTGGLGYAPLVGAKLRAEITGGVITNIVGVPTYGQAYQISTSTYNKDTGILEVTTSSPHTFTGSENDVYLEDLEFSCASAHAGITTTIFPDGTLGNVFPVVGIISATTFNVNIGVSTIVHNYVGQGSAFPYYSKLTFGSGYFNNVSIGVSDSSGSGADISVTVGAGGSLIPTISNGGSGYTNPTFDINDPSYENLPVIGVSRLGIGNTTQTGVGLSMTLEVGPSYAATGIGSTYFEIRSYEITKPGYSYNIGDTFKVVGLVTDSRLSSPIEELRFTVTDVFTDSFASWQLGEFDFIDSISALQDGERTRFPLYKNSQLLSFQKNNSNVDSSLIDLDAILLIYINGVMQEPKVSYEFSGGTTFSFKEAPKASDKIDIFFYRGTKDEDSIEVNVNESIKPGDTVQIIKNDNIPQTVSQDSRIVSEIVASDLIRTGIYLGDGIDDTNYKPIDWSKQKRDLLLNDNIQSKVRDSIEGMVFPTAKVIKDFTSADVDIFLDNAQFFNYEENESAISIQDVSGLLVQGGNDPISATFTANVSVAGTISSVTVVDGGSGYIPQSVLELKIGNPIGGIGTVFKFDVKRRPGILGIGSDIIVGIDTSLIKVGQAVKSIPNVLDTTVTVTGIHTGSGGSVLLSKNASNSVSLTRPFDFGRYQDQSVAIGSAFVSSAGIVTLTSINTAGAGYTSTYPPEVTVSTPNLSSELITNIRFVQGFSGIITGITTSTGINGNPLALTFHVLYDSASDINSLIENYPIYVFDTHVGHGVTSINGSDNSLVGIGSTFVDNIYYIHSITRDNLTGIITSNVLSTTNVSGVHTMPNSISGRFSWGRLSGFERSTSSIGVAVSGYTVNSGLTTFPTLQRREFGLRDSGALRKDLG